MPCSKSQHRRRHNIRQKLHSSSSPQSHHRIRRFRSLSRPQQLQIGCTIALVSFSFIIRSWTLQFDFVPTATGSTLLSFDSQDISKQSQLLNLIPNRQLQPMDYFSDSWLLSKTSFLRMDLKRIGIVEDACFVAAGKISIHSRSKMFVDWTDFMVEHMSKWWRSFFITEDADPTMFDKTISIFQSYLQKCQANENSPLHATIAMIASAPYKTSRGNRGQVLTAHSLAATIASLYQVGFGRVVVLGHNEDDKEYVDEAFRLLHATSSGEHYEQNRKIGNTELAYVRIANKTWLETKWVKFNMPRAAVAGMQLALRGQLEQDELKAWLGSSQERSYWKHVYLTEPDTILHTKPWLLSSMRDGLNRGLSFFPHRLLPLPHQADLPPSNDGYESTPYAGHFVPNIPPFSNITTINPGNGQHFCCDAGNALGEFKFDDCGRWWLCGFDPNVIQTSLNASEVHTRHKRLLPYPMMRLEGGVGVVFGSTERGRRCTPSNRPCNSVY